MVLFLHGCHNLYFRQNPVADYIFFRLFRRNHVADVFFDFSGKPSPKPISSLPLFLYYQHDAFIQTLGTWFGLRLTTLDALHRFREVLQGDLL